jgi:hypothetical protein
VWLLSIALAFGLILGQFADAGTFADHHTDTVVAGLSASPAHDGREVPPTPECHPGIACAAFVVPAGPSPFRTDSVVSVLRPDATQSQRRFGGPTVTLPPPRNLI